MFVKRNLAGLFLNLFLNLFCLRFIPFGGILVYFMTLLAFDLSVMGCLVSCKYLHIVIFSFGFCNG